MRNMKKLLVLLFILGFINSPCLGADEWTPASPAGTDSPSDLDSLIESNNNAIDRQSSKYRNGYRLEYASASTITIGIGEAMLSNSGGTTRLMVADTAAITAAWANIDTGAEAGSTTYYIFIGTNTSTDKTATAYITTSSTAPSGITYYKKLGSFVNDSNSNITDIQNDGFFTDLGTWISRTDETVYQASTDGFVTIIGHAYSVGYTDGSTPPTVVRCDDRESNNEGTSCSFPVKKGDYWKTSSDTDNPYWIPLQ